MESSRVFLFSTIISAIVSIILGALTFYFAYYKPQYIDGPELKLSEIPKLRISASFGKLQIQKDFTLTNIGKRASLINKVDGYLIDEKTYSTVYYGDVSFKDPFAPILFETPEDIITNTISLYTKRLHGFTVWPDNAVDMELAYVQHRKETELNHYQEIRDSILEKRKLFYNKLKRPCDVCPANDFNLNADLMNKIIEAQSLSKNVLNEDIYFFCERVITSEGKKLYQVYSFQISNSGLKTLQKLTSKILKEHDINSEIGITLDLKIASEEERKKIIKKVEKYVEEHS